MVRYVLASASPRRRELLEQIGMSFEVSPAGGKEHISEEFPADIVEALSREKACEVARNYRGKYKNDTVVIIGADTLVACGKEVMGKPLDEANAVQMLTRIQGGTHHVYTGVALVIMEEGKEKLIVFHEKTEVELYPITQEHIEAYVATGEPMDKAGAYAIQGRFAAYIKRINGDYNTVVGLPVARLMQELFALGLA